MLIAVVFFGMIIPGIIASVIGSSKERGGGIWLLLGLIFSWLAVLIVACLSYPEEARHNSLLASKFSQKESDAVRKSRQTTWEDFHKIDGTDPRQKGPSRRRPHIRRNTNSWFSRQD